MSRMVGGTSEEMEANEEVQKICEEVKSQVEEKTGRKFEIFTAKRFKTQMVAGTNYFIKVAVGGDECIHIRVFKSLPHAGEKLKLHGLQSPKTHQDAVEYF